MSAADLLPSIAVYTLQTTGVGLVACLAAVVVRLGPAHVRHAYWRVVLALCLALPGLERLGPSVSPPFGAVQAAFAIDAAAALMPVRLGPSTLGWWIVAVLVTGAIVRFGWLLVGIARLRSLRRAGRIVAPDVDAALQHVLGTGATVRYVDDLRQPVTFGARVPVVLLPASLRLADADVRQAVLCHELIHVRRRDWPWVLAEEAIRAVLWFHPVALWLISEIQVSREEVVDALSARVIGSRRVYAEALMTFGDVAGAAPAAAFGRRRHLVRRITRVVKEERMSVHRIWVSVGVVAVVLLCGSWEVARAFPLVQQSATGAATPSQRPQRLGPGIVAPKVIKKVRAEYPPDAKRAKIHGAVRLEVQIDTDGTVRDLRVVKSIPELDQAAIAAVRQWTFTPAMKGGTPVPVLVDITVRFTLK